MCRFALISSVLTRLVVAMLIGLATPAQAQRTPELHPDTLTAEQKELLNYCYLPLRLDLLPALKASGDQVVVTRSARLGINYIVSLQRTRAGEAIIQARRHTSPAMVKFVLGHAARVRDALSEEQRRAFTRLLKDQKLAPITVDANTRHFLLRYTFGPKDRVEKAKAEDGRILEVVVPEPEDIKKWSEELKTGADLVRLLENADAQVHHPVRDWLIQHGGENLDAAEKERLADLILEMVEKAESGDWMQAYSKVAQAEHEQRVWALVEKCGIHHVAGMIAAYAAVAPAKAVDYATKPTPDKHFSIRAVQGLGMAPDALRLLKSARAKKPDMAWKIDGEIKAIQDRETARAQGKPENPGLVELEARRKAEKEAAEQAREGKKPGDYQGYDDWFADLSSSDKKRIDKAAYHFGRSVHAVNLSTVTPQQRAAVFAIAHESLTANKRTMPDHYAGPILIASAGAENTAALLAMTAPDKRNVQFPVAALIRGNPDKAVEVILGLEGKLFGRVRDAVKLVPAEAIPVLRQAMPKFQYDNTREWCEKLIADCEQQAKQQSQ